MTTVQPPGRAEMFQGSVHEGKTCAEIAAAQGVSPEIVRRGSLGPTVPALAGAPSWPRWCRLRWIHDNLVRPKGGDALTPTGDKGMSELGTTPRTTCAPGRGRGRAGWFPSTQTGSSDERPAA